MGTSSKIEQGQRKLLFDSFLTDKIPIFVAKVQLFIDMSKSKSLFSLILSLFNSFIHDFFGIVFVSHQ